jgi:hypothetical protein
MPRHTLMQRRGMMPRQNLVPRQNLSFCTLRSPEACGDLTDTEEFGFLPCALRSGGQGGKCKPGSATLCLPGGSCAHCSMRRVSSKQPQHSGAPDDKMSSECPSKLSVVVRCRQGTSVTAHLERYNTTKQLFDILNIRCFQVTLFLSLTNLLPRDFSFHEGGRSLLGDAKPDPPKKKRRVTSGTKKPPYSRMPRRHRMSRGVVGSRRIPGTSRDNQSTGHSPA